MTFTMTLELPPGATYAELKRRVELVADKMPHDNGSKPDGPETITFKYGTGADVVGAWRITK